jgi:hypothetical protein
MLRRSTFGLWPPAMIVEEAAPALSHWNAAKPGSATLWPATPQSLNRYVNELHSAAASVFGAQSVMNAARVLRKRLLQR